MLDIPPNAIDLWLADERQISDPGLLAAYAGFLNEEEQSRHQRFIFDQHQHQFLVARALTRTVLSQYLGIDNPADVTFRKTALGKPELVSDQGISFNLSHTTGLVALAVIRELPVGVDVEHLDRQADILRLADRYFSPKEREVLKALPESDRNNRFYDLWTLKEAYLKGCGTGLRTPLDAFSFLLGDDTIDIAFESSLDDNPDNWHFCQLDVGGDYRLSLAVESAKAGPFTLRVRQGIPLQGFSESKAPVVRRSTSIR